MGIWIGRNRKVRIAYGFDDIAIAPGDSVFAGEPDTGFALAGSEGRQLRFKIPIIASAMDSVSNVETCAQLSALGSFGVLNLLGLQTRFEEPAEALGEIHRCGVAEITATLRRVYSEPIREELIGRRIAELKRAGAIAAVSATPDTAGRFGPLAQEAGADIFVVQSPAVPTRRPPHRPAFDAAALCASLRIPVIFGNAATFKAAEAYMTAGAAAVLVGMGPGTASTSQTVMAVGLPQVTATVDCAAARDHHLKQTGRYVPVITDGGIRRSEDLCKALACGSDAVMVGGLLAGAREAPGLGSHWGMQSCHPQLPVGTRVRHETNGSLKEILCGPASTNNGTQNLVGAIGACMALVGARTIRDLHNADIVIAPHTPREMNATHGMAGPFGTG